MRELPALPTFAELVAPEEWRVIDCMSDVHLRPDDLPTFEAWQQAMASSTADALFILGDLFEVWVGDDALDPAVGDGSPIGQFELRCAQVIRAARCPVYFMHGNRDFLLGATGRKAAGMQLLHDPTVLMFAGQRWLLSHGDALCLDDVAYQKFRLQVQNPAWQQASLQHPLAVRRQMARQIRQASEQRKDQGLGYADVDPDAVRAWLQASRSQTLIHGHTHLPADHALGDGLHRIVMSDWEAQAQPPRLEILRLSTSAPPQRVGVPRAA
ncbi:UDP-2,3-diacylglucosamine diphosphatase [Pseudorhodoferax sp. Leaf267]|uniref:UDP-2,3-diacylglucosamine diphosphatase n=1 Tax=Pseudorhodoferax sp. Leaf267 TaxID=1736316 RepID=UPI0006FBD54F|nr:UDP-2,3-diacylglucosamine diphosphatase [Pseudorhodoferax sp. Leaf267]KQP22045.1 UDP-2,3-diacylglucosamine hydrolase [Pseudorhodoferax sp. Leaf267]